MRNSAMKPPQLMSALADPAWHLASHGQFCTPPDTSLATPSHCQTAQVGTVHQSCSAWAYEARRNRAGHLWGLRPPLAELPRRAGQDHARIWAVIPALAGRLGGRRHLHDPAAHVEDFLSVLTPFNQPTPCCLRPKLITKAPHKEHGMQGTKYTQHHSSTPSICCMGEQLKYTCWQPP